MNNREQSSSAQLVAAFDAGVLASFHLEVVSRKGWVVDRQVAERFDNLCDMLVVRFIQFDSILQCRVLLVRGPAPQRRLTVAELRPQARAA